MVQRYRELLCETHASPFGALRRSFRRQPSAAVNRLINGRDQEPRSLIWKAEPDKSMPLDILPLRVYPEIYPIFLGNFTDYRHNINH
jgi:hypothetical protein